MTFMEFVSHKFVEGGLPVMMSILFVLGLTVIIVIERIFRFWVQFELGNSAGFMMAIQKMVMSNSIENAIRLCKESRPKLLPFVLSEGLKRANDTPEEVAHSMETATLSVVPRVMKSIPFLGVTANLATLLGLLGTIFGLMKSFGAAASATGAQKQTILAEGIAEALTATSFGLSTALLCILCHGFLSAKQNSILSNIHSNAARLSELLYTRSIKMKK